MLDELDLELDALGEFRALDKMRGNCVPPALVLGSGTVTVGFARRFLLECEHCSNCVEQLLSCNYI